MKMIHQYRVALFFLFLMKISLSHAQDQNTENLRVGINTDEPTETLHVNGEAHGTKLFLRGASPITGTEEGVSALGTRLGDSSPKEIRKVNQNYNGDLSTFTPVEYTFTNISLQGITDFDTKIPADRYLLVANNFFIGDASAWNKVHVPDLYGDKQNNRRSITPTFGAFVKNGTWHLQFFYKNSTLFNAYAGYNPDSRLIIYCLAFRNAYSREEQDLTVDLQNASDNGASLNIKDQLIPLITRPLTLNIAQ